MRILTLLGVFLTFALAGCGKNLRPDIVIPATQAKYPSAEFYACGKIFNGLGECDVDEGQELNSIDLKIQGYYKGTVKFSSNCELDSALPLSVRYSKNSIVPFHLPGPAIKTCGVSFVISPEYPNEQDQKLVIHSFKGHLLLKVKIPGTKWVGLSTKVKAGIGPSDVFKIKLNTNDEKVDVSFRSDRCEVNKDDLELDVNEGSVTVKLRELLSEVKIKTCILNGVVFTSEEAIRVSWFIAGYDPKFIPLPIPVTEINENKIKILADDNVSVISLDDTYYIDREIEIEFDITKQHIIRILTIGGRLALGIWIPEKGFEWML